MAENEEVYRRLREKLRRELGDKVLQSLDDPDVVEILLNPDGNLWIDSHRDGMRIAGQMSPIQAENLICTVASMLHTEATRERPIVEGELPLDGSRFEGVMPPLVEAPAFSIRKRAALVYTLADYVSTGIMAPGQLAILEQTINARGNILVAGATGSGKTTFCNALLQRIAEIDPDTRVLIIEDTRELQCPAVNRIELRTSEHVDMIRLLRASMRMRPDRIVVGEVRGPEALALLKAWNTGHPGGVATVHANGAEAALVRLEQLIQEANVLPNAAVIAEAVDLIVSIQRTREGRKVTEIVEVQGYSEGVYALRWQGGVADSII
jgi:P-type conjugative transfer ATPase TrbB